jgi:hypothetical protein
VAVGQIARRDQSDDELRRDREYPDEDRTGTLLLTTTRAVPTAHGALREPF